MNILNKIIRFVKDWTLPIAIALGFLCYKVIDYVSWTSPWFIFTMLFLTFCKIRIKDIRISWVHLWLLLIEIFGAILAYYIVVPFNEIMAQGVLVCIICPTATAAAVITNKLHGDIGFVSSYTLLCNVVVAIVVPLFFPLIYRAEASMTFWHAFYLIIRKIFPLLILPFIAAQLVRYFTPKLHAKIYAMSDLAFYLWAISLTIAIGLTFKSWIDNPTTLPVLIGLCGVSAGACAVQFAAGKLIGKKYGFTISAGQSLGQKNTILAIWMCNVYLNPLCSVSAGAYVIWQNCFNSWQLYRERKKNGAQ